MDILESGLLDSQEFCLEDILEFAEVDILVSDPWDIDQESVQVGDTGLVSRMLGIVEDNEVSGKLVSDLVGGTQVSGLGRLGCAQVSAGGTQVSGLSDC